MKFFVAVYLLFGSMYLQASEPKIPTRIKIVAHDRTQAMMLVDTEHFHPVGSHVFQWVGTFNKVGTHLLAKAKNMQGKFGFIRPDGEWIVPAVLDIAKSFSDDNISRVKQNRMWGFVKDDGAWLVKPMYEYVTPFRDGYAVVVEKKTTHAYFLNTKGKKAFGREFSRALNFCSDGLASVAIKKPVPSYIVTPQGVTKETGETSQEFWGKIDRTGKVVMALEHPRSKIFACKDKKTDKTKPGFTPLIVRKNKKWGFVSESKKFHAFPDEILAPLADMDAWKIRFVDGLAAVIDKERTLKYYDASGNLKYHFAPNNEGSMSFYDAHEKEIYKTEIKSVKAYASLARGAEEHFIDPKNYSKNAILRIVDTMMKEKFKRYQLPNLVFGSRDDRTAFDLYKIEGDSESIKTGVATVLAQGYVDENAWGNHEYLSDQEFSQFYHYLETIGKWIQVKYGKPIKKEHGSSLWKMGDKYLKLGIYGDSGDGDFYHILTLEVNGEAQ